MMDHSKQKENFESLMGDFRLQQHISFLIVSQLLNKKIPSINMINYYSKIFVEKKYVSQSVDFVNNNFEEYLKSAIKMNKDYNETIPIPVDIVKQFKDMIVKIDTDFQYNKSACLYNILTNMNTIQGKSTFSKIPEYFRIANELEENLAKQHENVDTKKFKTLINNDDNAEHQDQQQLLGNTTPDNDLPDWDYVEIPS